MSAQDVEPNPDAKMAMMTKVLLEGPAAVAVLKEIRKSEETYAVLYTVNRGSMCKFLDLLYAASKSLTKEQIQDSVRFVFMLSVKMNMAFDSLVQGGELARSCD